MNLLLRGVRALCQALPHLDEEARAFALSRTTDEEAVAVVLAALPAPVDPLQRARMRGYERVRQLAQASLPWLRVWTGPYRRSARCLPPEGQLAWPKWPDVGEGSQRAAARGRRWGSDRDLQSSRSSPGGTRVGQWVE